MTNDEMIKGIYEDVTALKQQVREIRLTLENETNRKIRAIAEGHLGLFAENDGAANADDGKEMLMLRVNALESEIKKLKERISQIA